MIGWYSVKTPLRRPNLFLLKNCPASGRWFWYQFKPKSKGNKTIWKTWFCRNVINQGVSLKIGVMIYMLYHFLANWIFIDLYCTVFVFSLSSPFTVTRKVRFGEERRQPHPSGILDDDNWLNPEKREHEYKQLVNTQSPLPSNDLQLCSLDLFNLCVALNVVSSSFRTLI